jgi:activating signal cointegrator complex subunit 3
MQMMGRAGRPQYDKHGVAVIMVQEGKKAFYKKFLYEPFPVESSLHKQLDDHLNAEIAMGTIESMQDGIDFLTYTFFLRRLLQNPSYYGLTGTDTESVSSYLSLLVGDAVDRLAEAHCVEIDDEGDVIQPTFLGRVASSFYLKPASMKVFEAQMARSMDVIDVIRVLCNVEEFSELPVRHNEDVLNAELIPKLRYPIPLHKSDQPSCKAEILIQAHLDRLQLPVSDYVTDTRGVLDNSTRILQAMIEVAAERGWWKACYAVMKTIQGLMQARWPDDKSPRQLPPGSLPNMSFAATFSSTATKNSVEISGKVLGKSSSRIRKAFAPCFPKVKEEGWWAAVVDGDALLSLRRFSVPGKATLKISLDPTAALAKLLHESRLPSVHVVSDSYIGVDVALTPRVV